MRVLVTDGDARASLAITRSLGRRGHEVLVGECHGRSLAHASRYNASSIVYPDPVSHSGGFVDTLARIARERHVEAIIPVADIATLLITRNRDRFPASCRIPFAAADVIERAANKVDIVETAVRAGVPVPRSVVVPCPGDVPRIDFEFPVVIKPRQSRLRTANGWVSSTVSYADTHAGLLRDLSGRPPYEFPLMVQERIVGPGVGVFACYRDGRPVALFSHRRLRERPPWGGVSVLAESVALNPTAQAYATRLLGEIGWQGVAMVEFKEDVRDGQPKLMEINGRFWGSLQLAIDAGVDFPSLLLDAADRGEGPQPYSVGVRTRWFWGDVDSLLASLFGRSRAPKGWPFSSPLRSIVDFARFWGAGLHYDNPKLDDPWPFAVESYGWFRSAARGVLKRRPRKAVAADASQSSRQVVAAEPRPRAGAGLVAQRGRVLTTRVAPTLEAIGLNTAEWNALALKSATSSIFQTHQWTESWWKTSGRPYEPLFIVADDGNGVQGVAPMVVEDGLSGERLARFLSDERADYCDILAPVGKSDITRALVEGLLESDAWDVIELNNLLADSPTVEALRAASERNGYPILVEDRCLCPTLLIEGHEAEARAIFNKPSLRRRQNYFQRAGRLVCRHLTAYEEIEPRLEPFFEQHVSRWDGTGSPSLFLTDRNRAFYRELAARVAPEGWLHFTSIELDGHPVAFHYGFDYRGGVMWYKPSFDKRFAAHSPGLVLVRHLIGDAIDRGLREFDFTLGDEAFKTRFTNSWRKTVRIQIFHDSARLLMERARRKAVKAMRMVGAGSAARMAAALVGN